MPRITLASLPAGADAVAALGPWLSARTGPTLWLTATPALAADVRRRVPPSVAVHDLQSFADELVFTHDPSARPLRPRHNRLIAAEIATDDRPVSRGEAERIAGSVAELKRAGVAEKQWPKSVRKAVATWERARVTLGLLDPEDRLRKAEEVVAARTATQFTAVALSGFDTYPTPVYESLRVLVDGCEHVALAYGGRAVLPAWVDDDPDPDRVEIDSPAPPDVRRIRAPGPLGESRMVARQLREWIDGGVSPSEIVVTCRRPEDAADLYAATFADYGIPFDSGHTPTLAHAPSVATLLRGWRLPLDGFPFSGVGELLRSGFFRPTWPDVVKDPDLPLRAEGLLRTLGRPSGKESFLAAVEQWVVAPIAPLEDEGGDRPRRERLEALAGHCRPFLREFFGLWDDDPTPASAIKWVERLRAFAALFGLAGDTALTLFWAECDSWATADAPALKLKRLTLERFTDAIERIAADTPGPSDEVKLNAVRLLTPDDARHVPCHSLVFVDLGEGSFPDTATAPSLMSDFDRRTLGSDLLPTAETRLDRDVALFTDLLARPTAHVLLSRQAVDEAGGERLPSSLLAEWEARHPDGPAPTLQKMTVEGYAHGPAYSQAERRTQAARVLRINENSDVSDGGLSPDLLAILGRAKEMAAKRFHSSSFTEFDGRLSHPNAVNRVKQLLLPAKPVSPSSLETYVDCPFRYWLEKVLKVEPLDEPSDEIEFTRRGQAVHRALSRFHQDLNAGRVDADLAGYVTHATAEYGERSGTPLGRVLWELEGKRLARSMKKYAGQTEKYRGEWEKAKAVPQPSRFEQAFGSKGEVAVPPLVIDVGGVSVAIAGTVDRVDVVELDGERGYVVIDYKTGRGTKYTSPDVINLNALQLPLYALALERTVFADRPSRPLAMVYWMPSDGGAKFALPGKGKTSWLTDDMTWPKFREQLETRIATLMANARVGLFPLAPRKDDCTATCPFGPTCRIAQSRSVEKNQGTNHRDTESQRIPNQ
jgi:RecB family exonuclease